MEQYQKEWMREQISKNPQVAIDALGGGGYSDSDPDVWFHFGLAHFKLKNFRYAEKCFRKTINLGRNTATTWFYTGWSMEKQSNANGALSAYRTSLSLDPNMKGAKEGIYRLAEISGDPTQRPQPVESPHNPPRRLTHKSPQKPAQNPPRPRVSYIGKNQDDFETSEKIHPTSSREFEPVTRREPVPPLRERESAAGASRTSNQQSPVGPIGLPPRKPSTRHGIVGRVRSVKLQGVSWNGQMGAKQSLSFRVDVPDGSGNLKESIQVEMRGFRISGGVENGDWVELDQISRSGDVKGFENVTTGQYVRTRLF